MRYERFIEGVALAEKVRLLRESYREQGNADALERLERVVRLFETETYPEGHTAATLVDALRREVNAGGR